MATTALTTKVAKSRLSLPSVDTNPQPPGGQLGTEDPLSSQLGVMKRQDSEPLQSVSQSSAPTPAPNPFTTTNAFGFTSYNPSAGQPDPRDATYWANLSKLMFNAQQGYSQSLLEGQYAGEDYDRAMQALNIENERSGRYTAEDYQRQLGGLETAKKYAEEDYGLAAGNAGRGIRRAGEDLSRSKEALAKQLGFDNRSLAEQAIRNNLTSSGWKNRTEREQKEGHDWDVQTQQISHDRRVEDLSAQINAARINKERNLDAIQRDMEGAGIIKNRSDETRIYSFLQEVESLNINKTRGDAARIAAQQAILQGFSIDEAGLLAEAAAAYADRQAQISQDAPPDYGPSRPITITAKPAKKKKGKGKK